MHTKTEKEETTTVAPVEQGPFIVIVDDSSDNHYYVGPFSDRDKAQVFVNQLAGQAGMLTTSRIVSQWSEDDVLKLYPAPEPLVITEEPSGHMMGAEK